MLQFMKTFYSINANVCISLSFHVHFNCFLIIKAETEILYISTSWEKRILNAQVSVIYAVAKKNQSEGHMDTISLVMIVCRLYIWRERESLEWGGVLSKHVDTGLDLWLIHLGMGCRRPGDGWLVPTSPQVRVTWWLVYCAFNLWWGVLGKLGSMGKIQPASYGCK